VVRKPKRQPEVFSGYENFIYLLTELELVVDAGTIQWSATTAGAATRRLEKLAARTRLAITQIENEQSN
jgi:hypothetical protein